MAGSSGTNGGRNRQLTLFFLGAACLAMTGAIFDTTFSNYVYSRFNISPSVRGALEAPREAPGFLVTLVAAALMFLPEVRVASLAALMAAAGILGLAFWSPTLGAMMPWMILFSTGIHLMMPVEGAMALGLAEEGRRGKRLGQLGMATTAGSLLACLAVYLFLRRRPTAFHIPYSVAAVLAAATAAIFLAMRPHVAHRPDRPRFVFRRRYWVYYLLSALFGARKQVFLTFGPWVIVTLFHQQAPVLALLYFIGRSIGVGFKPLLGRLIDRAGPRPVLVGEAVLLIGVCLGYVWGIGLKDTAPATALVLVCGCYVLDDLFFAFEMARTTYVANLAQGQDDLTGTLAAGVSINHAVSVIVPAFGGLLWVAAGDPRPVFMAAAAVMVVSGLTALLVRAPGSVQSAAAAPPAAVVHP